jgi:hypothetical protein
VSGARSRRKGARFERAIVHRFREVMPGTEIRRGLQSRSGEEVPDVDVPCFWPELKHHRRTNVRAALEQAVTTAPKGRWPIAVCKDDQKPALVAMDLEDFLDLVSEWWRAQTR